MTYSPDDIADQQERLNAERARLAVLLLQKSQHGSANMPPAVATGIPEARAEIRRIKATLRSWGVPVDDHANDDAPTSSPTPHEQPAAPPRDTLPTVAPLPLGSRMPFARNPLFVGREGELRAIAQTLLHADPAATAPIAAIGQIAAAIGLGGIGKTNLATEFVHRYSQFFPGGSYWLNFASAEGVTAEIVACGGPDGMNLVSFESLKLDDQINRVLQEWRAPTLRLLVFDNCEDDALLARWRQPTGGCRILVTSRRATWDPTLGVVPLALSTLPRDESIALLRMFRPDLAALDPDLDAIADELGDLPLALHLAGSYLAKYQHVVLPANYLKQLRSPALLQHRSLQGSGLSPTGHVLDVGRTFALSYDRLDAADPDDARAIALLARAAHFAAGEPIARDLMRATLFGVPAELDVAVTNAADEAAFQAEDAIARLVDLGLLEAAANGVRLHRLLAAFTRALDADASAADAVEQVLLTEAQRRNTAGDPEPILILQTHLRQITDAALLRQDARAATLCQELADNLRQLGNYTDARIYTEHSLAILQRIYGMQHADTARSLNDMGFLLQSQGDLIGARPYLEQALEIRRVVLGERHPDTATSMDNLGALLQNQGDLPSARPYFEQALAIRRAVLGERHPDTATSLNNMGFLLQSQGDLAGARPYYEQALNINRTVLGERHPDTASSLNNMGLLLQDQGDLSGARTYYEQALKISRATLGERHPETTASLYNLGRLLQAQGDLPSARAYYERALEISRAMLGERHHNTARTMQNLAVLLAQQQNYYDAARLLRTALSIFTAALGAHHPDTQTALQSLAAAEQRLPPGFRTLKPGGASKGKKPNANSKKHPGRK